LLPLPAEQARPASGRCRQRRQVDSGVDAQPVQHVDHVLAGDVAAGAARVRAAAGPETEASTTATPSSRQARTLASAWPQVSWKCTASAAIGTSPATALQHRRALPGVPTPMVSPSETS
jgi:hypothetical protein